jgi:hypothetical protein
MPTGTTLRTALTPYKSVKVVSPAPRDVWNGLFASDPDALVSQTPRWIDCICTCGPYEDVRRLYELAGGRLAVLPMGRRRDLPRPLTTEASLPPFWNAGGIVACGGATAEDVVAVLSDLASRPILRTSLRPGPLDAQVWASARPRAAVVVPRLAHVLELQGGFGRIWKERFTGTTRTAVRKAERLGLTVQRDTSGKLVPVIYELFERSVERWAHQQHEPLPLARWRSRRRERVSLRGGRLRVGFDLRDDAPRHARDAGVGDVSHRELPRRSQDRASLLATAGTITAGAGLVLGLAFALVAPGPLGLETSAGRPAAVLLFASGVAPTAVTLVIDQAISACFSRRVSSPASSRTGPSRSRSRWGGLQLRRNIIFAVSKLLLLAIAAVATLEAGGEAI